jgi:aromatic ring-opening dioxygenase LigB subunit
MTGTVRIGVIAPHGDLAIGEACSEEQRSLAPSTQLAMQEMARRVAAAAPDVAVVATPHNVHVEGHMAVLTSSAVAGRFEEAANQLPLSCRVDRDLAVAIHRSMNDAGIPTVAISFGGNVAAESSSPIDWGTLVPMWHIGREAPDLPVVVVAPARDLEPHAHVLAGATIVRAARELGRSLAFVASADQGHGHLADGPYGFHAESAEFDAKAVDIVRRGALQELTAIPVEQARAALVDSWWQMLMLHGALEEDGGGFEADMLAYEAPTYYGMLTATFRPPR